MDYKKYSLENLENWLYDAMSAGEATPQEIYDVIVNVVKDNYYTYKKQASQAYELLALLNGNGKGHIEEYDDYLRDKEAYDAAIREKEYYEPSMPPWGHSDLEYMIHNKESLSCDKDDSSPECKGAWNDFWEDSMPPWGHSVATQKEEKGDKVVKWQLPVQVDGLSGDCFVEFPDDLLEAANLKEGDTVNWIDRGDGSFELRKVTEPLGMDEC
jgi:hypothetical protein